MEQKKPQPGVGWPGQYFGNPHEQNEVCLCAR
jgi:hypothetical protein